MDHIIYRDYISNRRSFIGHSNYSDDGETVTVEANALSDP